MTDSATSLIRMYHEGKATLDMAGMAPLSLDVSRTVSLSLVSYELILNAMKYAWPAGPPGALTIGIVDVVDAPRIEIADDGVGFAEAVFVRGMGSRITSPKQWSRKLALTSN